MCISCTAGGSQPSRRGGRFGWRETSLEKQDADWAKCVKNKVQTLLFCLYKGTSLFIPKTFLLENKTKQNKKNSFLMTIYTDRSNRKGSENKWKGRGRSSKRRREISTTEQHKRFFFFKWCEGQTRRQRAVHGQKRGYTAVWFLFLTSRASAEEMPLNTKERGRLQYSRVSAL